MDSDAKRAVELGLKVAAGKLAAVRRMAGQDVYCVDLMKQLSAVQAQLEPVNRDLQKNHLSTRVTEAIRSGEGERKIEELMQALKYNGGLTGVNPDLAAVATVGLGAAARAVALFAAGKLSPAEIARMVGCSRSTLYRAVRAASPGSATDEEGAGDPSAASRRRR